MRILLDTHVAIWLHADDQRLIGRNRQLLADAEELVVSAASAWEIAIKTATGKLRSPPDFDEVVVKAALTPIDVTFADAMATARLPTHHKDPFDRLLIAQAQIRGLTIATRDRQLQKYDVPVVLV